MSRVPDDVADAIQRRSGGVCEAMIPGVCGWQAHHFHHRRMRSQQGGDTAENLAVVCAFCHDFIHKNAGFAYEAGLLVRSVRDPAETPMVYRGAGEPVLLRDVEPTII